MTHIWTLLPLGPGWVLGVFILCMYTPIISRKENVNIYPLFSPTRCQWPEPALRWSTQATGVKAQLDLLFNLIFSSLVWLGEKERERETVWTLLMEKVLMCVRHARAAPLWIWVWGWGCSHKRTHSCQLSAAVWNVTWIGESVMIMWCAVGRLKPEQPCLCLHEPPGPRCRQRNTCVWHGKHPEPGAFY